MSDARTPEEIETAVRVLKNAFPENGNATTLTVHVTSAGTRSILLLVGRADGTVDDLSWAAARVLGWKFDRVHGGVKVSGGNVDHGFHLVSTLSRTLYGDGYSVNRRFL
jgi:hypothetical protein